ncbi:MAG: hypothetical protein ACLFR1_09370 [Spirochaetia bacterium]
MGVIAQFFGSWISDYIPIKYLAFLQNLSTGVLCFAIIILGPEPQIILLVAGMGVLQGMMGITGNITWPRYFGLRRLGAVSGFAMAWTVAGSAVSPYVFNLSLEVTGSYGFPAAVLCGMSLLLMISTLFVKKPA